MKQIQNKHWYPIVLILLGAFLFSAKAVVVKLTYRYEISAIGSLFFRMLFAFPFLVAIAWKEEKNAEPISKRDWWIVVFLGIVGYYLASLFDFIGLLYISAGLERIILFIYPTFVVLISYFVYKKKIYSREVLSLVLTYVGVLIAYGQDVRFGEAKSVTFGAFCIFLSALTYAIYLLGSGSIIPKMGAQRFTAWALLVSTGIVFLHFLLFGDWRELVQPTSFYALAFLLGTVNTVIPAVLVSSGVKKVGSKVAAIVASVGPMSTLFLAYFFLDEPITVWHSLGTVLVLMGVFWISSQKPEKTLNT